MATAWYRHRYARLKAQSQCVSCRQEHDGRWVRCPDCHRKNLNRLRNRRHRKGIQRRRAFDDYLTETLSTIPRSSGQIYRAVINDWGSVAYRTLFRALRRLEAEGIVAHEGTLGAGTWRRTNRMIILPQSHLDHGVTTAQLAWAMKQIHENTEPDGEVHSYELCLPLELGTVESALYGPAAGDEPIPEVIVRYQVRGDRAGRSRIISAPTRKTSKLTVVVGPFGVHPAVLYTIHGGPPAPREPFELDPDTPEYDESVSFWDIHALADGSELTNG